VARRVRIIMDCVEVMAELGDTRTAQAIWDVLPIRAEVNTWGKEIYFPIPVSLELEGEQETVAVGDLGYWPSGRAFCIFFGPTPASRGEEIRPASPVNVFGRVIGDTKSLEGVSEGTAVVVEKE
jgi:hypothetical protein